MTILLSSSQKHWLDFLRVMTVKEIKARYKHALLGFLWVLLNPVLQMMVMGFVFHFFIPVSVPNYFLFLFAGLLPWNFFSLSLQKSTPAIVFERSLIKKARFPRESIILSLVLSNLFHFIVSEVLLVVVVLVMLALHGDASGLVPLISRLLLLPLLCIWLTILTSGLSLLTSALNVRFRDINFFVTALIPLWFYATPIIYTLNLLPSSLQTFFYLNPMTAITEGFQYVFVNTTVNNLQHWALSIGISLLCMVFGYYVFDRESKHFDDWL